MKRLITVTLSAALACATALALTACGQQGGSSSASAASSAGESSSTSVSAEVSSASASAGASSEASVSSSEAAIPQFATLGDVFNAETEEFSSTYDEQRYVCAFKLDGQWWRVEAPLESGMFGQIDKLWVEDQEKVEELISPLAISKVEGFDTPSEDDLDALVGKTGGELTAEGFKFIPGSAVAGDSETDCNATMGFFDYVISFDGVVADENTDDLAGAVANMKVTNAEIQGLTWSLLEGN